MHNIVDITELIRMRIMLYIAYNCYKGVFKTKLLSSFSERSPIRLRTQPNQIANANESDCERERIGLRSKNDDFCIDFALFI